MNEKQEQGDELPDLECAKGRIILASLKLFARSGYHAVSVRDIAKEVGIKDASIYSHFAGKDDLLDAIVNRFKVAFKASVPDVSEFDRIMNVCDPRSFLVRGFTIFRERLEDPVMAWTYFVLIREKFDDDRAAQAWQRHKETVIQYVAEAFSAMMRRGTIRECDPVRLARVYEYPVFILMEDYVHRLCEGEDTSELSREFIDHIDFFLKLILN